MRIVKIIALILLAAMIVAACGGGNASQKETPSATKSPAMQTQEQTSSEAEMTEPETAEPESTEPATEPAEEKTSEAEDSGYEPDLSMFTIPDDSIATGIYQLDLAYWSEESKQELLGGYNPISFLSIGPEGKAYLMLGRNPIQEGTLMMSNDPAALSKDEPNCVIWFEDGKVMPAYYYQMTLTIHGMEEAKLTEDALEGLDGSVWTYGWLNAEFWTEESLRDDIG